MKIIVGLGNPGDEYANTRHNVGWLVVDALANKYDFEFKKKRRLKAVIAEGNIGEEKVVLVKPQTFMNLSGKSVRKVFDFYKGHLNDLWAVYDEADLAFGEIKKRRGGSSAGHNGVESIIETCQRDFLRFRVGIGRSENKDIPLDVHVLQPWTKLEAVALPNIIDRVVEMIEKELVDEIE